MNDRFVIKRFLNIFFILLTALATTTVICMVQKFLPDQILSIYLIDFIFFVIFLFVLEHNRSQRIISANRETDFKKVMIGFQMSAVIALICVFAPEFLKPVILIPIFMTALSSQGLAICVGIFWNCVLCLCLGFHAQELVLYCLMTLFGAMLVEAIENTEVIIWYQMIIFALSVMMPEIFYYLTYQEVKMSLFAYGAIQGTFVLALIVLFYQKLVHIRDSEVTNLLEDMLYDTYPMVRELSSFSKQEYQHAKRVSEIAKKCALVVDADEKVCAAAGFYYRIGIIEGEPIGMSGIRIAQRNCFPEQVLQIICEYNGEEALPSSVESAIVHMVDGLVKKMEALGSKTLASEWNQDMVIYQTLNEFSTKGLYDKSGLSMNMFLKIREYLVNEEALL